MAVIRCILALSVFAAMAFFVALGAAWVMINLAGWLAQWVWP